VKVASEPQALLAVLKNPVRPISGATIPKLVRPLRIG
jgi:hypothetical protein